MDRSLLADGGEELHRVAIIGAGWSGLQCAHNLKQRGIKADIFDKNTVVGGTWSPEMSYRNLALHSARWLNQMTLSSNEFLPFPEGEDGYMNERADASEMLQYLKDFVSKCDLQPQIQSCSIVKEVHYDSTSRLAFLVVEQDSSTKRVGPYNLVVFASLSGMKRMPDIPNRGFSGKLLHSSQLKADTMTDIISSHSKVLIIGAAKSGCDMVEAFQREGYENVTWLHRKSYWFFKYRAFFHHRSFLEKMRAVLFLACFMLFFVAPSVAMFTLWAIGYIVQPDGIPWPKHFDAKRFHFGIIDDRTVAFVRKLKPVIGDPDHFHKSGVVLKSGETIDCDVIICATGYDTGLESIQCIKDGKPHVVTDCPLYEHAIVPRFPCLLSAPTAFYHFGPIRAVTLAEYVIHVLQRESLSEDEMERIASKNLCKQTPSTFMAYSSSRVFTRDWLWSFVDFWRTGLMSVSAFLEMAFGSFVTHQYKPLRLNVKAQ
ncbi:unnamed protein product [Effrenium voratum]|nr:unnamed protein product [Effrenium voratum]